MIDGHLTHTQYWTNVALLHINRLLLFLGVKRPPFPSTVTVLVFWGVMIGRNHETKGITKMSTLVCHRQKPWGCYCCKNCLLQSVLMPLFKKKRESWSFLGIHGLLITIKINSTHFHVSFYAFSPLSSHVNSSNTNNVHHSTLVREKTEAWIRIHIIPVFLMHALQCISSVNGLFACGA